MRKIRGFKLKLRPKEIQRRAKKAKLDLAALGLDHEAALTTLLNSFANAAKASVIYDSFPAEQEASLAPVPGLAYSLAVTTLGADIEPFIQQAALDKQGLGPLLEIISQSALDDAAQFVLRLVEEEAREERCELSPIQYLTDQPSLQNAVGRLEGHKINVIVSDQGLRPVNSAAFSISWLARAKTRAR